MNYAIAYGAYRLEFTIAQTITADSNFHQWNSNDCICNLCLD
jgi:hypothetical protein